jgi:hypothetical protein
MGKLAGITTAIKPEVSVLALVPIVLALVNEPNESDN